MFIKCLWPNSSVFTFDSFLVELLNLVVSMAYKSYKFVFFLHIRV